MHLEETLVKANRIIKSGLSDEMLFHLISLLMDPNVSCDGIVLLLNELSKAITYDNRE